MRVYNNHSPSQDPICFLDFENLAKEYPEVKCDLFYGGHPNEIVKSLPRNGKRVFFTTEEQSWGKDSTDRYLPYFDKILTICPPDVTGRANREFVFFPFSEKNIPTKFDKKYDVIYAGLSGGDHVNTIIDTITKFNYCYVSFGDDRRITHHNIGYLEKLSLYSASKISPLHNLTNTGTPQIKTRPFEAAIGKSLILCQRDNWNIIERFFEPNKEFIYFNNQEDLFEKIKFILANYSDYTPMIEAAFHRAINEYTSRKFIEKYVI